MDESNCKSNFAPPSVIRNGAMEQVYRSGEDNFNDGHDRFLAGKKNRTIFRPSRVHAIFREVRFYLNSLNWKKVPPAHAPPPGGHLGLFRWEKKI